MEMDELEAAIQQGERSLKTTPQDHPYRSRYLNTQGCLFLSRYELRGNREDLKNSIRNTTLAVELTSEDDPELPGRLSYLAIALARQYERTGEEACLDAAIEKCEGAVKGAPRDHPDLPFYLDNLGSLLVSRYQLMGDNRDLGVAISMAQRAVERTPQDHLDLDGRLLNLEAYLNITPKLPDLDDKVESLCRWKLGNGLGFSRFYSAIQDLKQLKERKNFAQASKVAKEAILLLSSICNSSLNRQNQETVALLDPGLAADACSLSLEVDNNAEEALILLERGRGTIWGYQMDCRFEEQAARYLKSLGTTISNGQEELGKETFEAAPESNCRSHKLCHFPRRHPPLLEPQAQEIRNRANEGQLWYST